ncbi:unnamed protein product [Closterium sp. Yama58-4]|nr:unnamed protein product [Closterium sp. Yama58-4]
MDDAEANGKSGAVCKNEVDEAVDEAGGEPEEEEDLAEEDAEDDAEEEEGDEAEEEEGDEAEEEEGDEAEEEEGDESEKESEDESGGEPSDEGDEESEEEQEDEEDDAAEVAEGADAHKTHVTKKASFDEMLEEQGDSDGDAMEDEAVAEERALLPEKLKALDEIKEPIIGSKFAGKGAKPLSSAGPSKVPPKPPQGNAAVAASKGKEKLVAKESMLSGKTKRESTVVVGGAPKKQNTGEVSGKAKATPKAVGVGARGVKAKAAAPKDSGAAPPLKVITEATKRFELIPAKKTKSVAASCDRRREHVGVSNADLDQVERRVMAWIAEMLSAMARGAGQSVGIGTPAAAPPHAGPSTSSSEGLPSGNSPLANHREIVYKAVVDFKVGCLWWTTS